MSTKAAEASNLVARLGLEIHARISAKSKIFSDADNFEISRSAVNSAVSFFDSALPGTMPTLNRRCVQAALLASLALKCKINSPSYFERKHYFYADLPAGYQITQQKKPIAIDGLFQYPVIDPKSKKLSYKSCKIRRIQLEHDSAKSLKTNELEVRLEEDLKLPKNSTLIDLNRAGMGLMEIVTEPDFESAFDSYSFVRELALVLRSIDASKASMGEGGFRVDVNVSVHKLDKHNNLFPATRVELKNLGSFSAVLKAAEFEIQRQKKIILGGNEVLKETRSFDGETGKTVSIRSKEDQYDYRFMPEPNLPPLFIRFSQPNDFLINDSMTENDDGFSVDLDTVKKEFDLKILPQTKRDSLKEKYQLNDETCFIFVANRIDFILDRIMNTEQKNEEFKRLLVRVLLVQYLTQVNKNPNIVEMDLDVKCKKIESYVLVLQNQLISPRIKYDLFEMLFAEENREKNAMDLVKEKNLFLIKDKERIEKVMKDLMAKNPKAVEEYKAKEKKRQKIFDFFVGRVHREFNELTDEATVDELVKSILKHILN